MPGYGELVYNERDLSLGAHCGCANHVLCRLNRTVVAGGASRPAQGRPIGQLVAWLRAGAAYETRGDHFAARRQEAAVSFPQRLAARRWLEGLPGMADLFALERPQRPGEHHAEPDGLAG